MKRWNDQYSLVRVFHAVPGQGAVDVFVNGDIFFKDLTFGNFSPYIYMPEGEYTIEVFEANTRENPMAIAAIEIGVDELITIAIAGSTDEVELFEIPEQKETPTDDTSLVRGIDLVQGLPSFDILVDGNEVISGIEYGGITDYVSATPGLHNVEIVSSDTNQLIGKTRVRIRPNRVYTVYFIGNSPSIALVQSADGASFLI